MTVPQMLLGSTRSTSLLARMAALGWGRLVAGEEAKPKSDEAWALDNGVFGAFKAGRAWTDTTFTWGLNRAERSISSGRIMRPLFAVLPDVVGSADSLQVSLAWHAQIGRLFDMPWYLVLQDGMLESDVAAVLQGGQIAGLFLGGSDAFKATAPAWCELAHAHGAKFHFARVSTVARLQQAHAIGADSCDTTQPLWSEKAFARFESAWRELSGARA